MDGRSGALRHRVVGLAVLALSAGCERRGAMADDGGLNDDGPALTDGPVLTDGPPLDAPWLAQLELPYDLPDGEPRALAMDRQRRVAACGTNTVGSINGDLANSDYTVGRGGQIPIDLGHRPAAECRAIALIEDGPIVVARAAPQVEGAGVIAVPWPATVVAAAPGGFVAADATRLVRYAVVDGVAVERWRRDLAPIASVAVVGAATATPWLAVAIGDEVRAYADDTGAPIAGFGASGTVTLAGTAELVGFADGAVAAVSTAPVTVHYLDGAGAVIATVATALTEPVRIAPLHDHRLAVQLDADVAALGVLDPIAGWSGFDTVAIRRSPAPMWFAPHRLVSDGDRRVLWGGGNTPPGPHPYQLGPHLFAVELP